MTQVRHTLTFTTLYQLLLVWMQNKFFKSPSRCHKL